MREETFLSGKVALRTGNCAEIVESMPDSSVDSVVCDPPYALVSIVKRLGKPGSAPVDAGKHGAYARASAGFMGKQWDTGDTAFDPAFWAECLRVLKPGGHVAAFGGTRTYHRLACAIEDAGFEIRDQLAWTYGSGFPKSHDVSKGIDRAAGAEREVVGKNPNHRAVSGVNYEGVYAGSNTGSAEITAPATDAAREWQGWGTALKPAWEPICLARKPLSEKSVAANVLRWRTGAINIRACRVPGEKPDTTRGASGDGYGMEGQGRIVDDGLGRFPANLIHDGSPEVLAAFPESGPAHSGGRSTTGHDDAGGSAARFFYTAKADADDRLGFKHPTIKPVDLMQWLVRLVTPKGGLVLDPFAGSGTTGEAAWREGMRAVLIEREEEYQGYIRRRMELAEKPTERSAVAKAKGNIAEHAGPLFQEAFNV